jgi:hypothetical protein
MSGNMAPILISLFPMCTPGALIIIRPQPDELGASQRRWPIFLLHDSAGSHRVLLMK